MSIESASDFEGMGKTYRLWGGDGTRLSPFITLLLILSCYKKNIRLYYKEEY